MVQNLWHFCQGGPVKTHIYELANHPSGQELAGGFPNNRANQTSMTKRRTRAIHTKLRNCDSVG